MDAKRLLEQLIQANSLAMDAAFADEEIARLIGRCQNYASDYELLQSTICLRPEATMALAGIQEFQRSWYQAVLANYRSAFASLRLSAELLFGSIYFSVYELKLRRWLKNEQDVIWSSIVDREEGLFSKNFIGAFDEMLSDDVEKYHSLVCKVYRECSEFVHGNMLTHTQLTDSIEYKPVPFRSWADKAESIRVCFVFVFAARYLCVIKREDKLKIEGLLMQEFSHLLGIQAAYGARGRL